MDVLHRADDYTVEREAVNRVYMIGTHPCVGGDISLAVPASHTSASFCYDARMRPDHVNSVVRLALDCIPCPPFP
eukprot:5956501-Amphidinium_carterae.1